MNFLAIKPCQTCRYFVKATGKCIVPTSKKIEYVDATYARWDKSLCGLEGKYHKEFPPEPEDAPFLYLADFYDIINKKNSLHLD
jgi:hypothetical protein